MCDTFFVFALPKTGLAGDKQVMQLHGQTVLVTGGAQRLGLAITEALLSAGAFVVVHHHTSAGAAAALLRQHPSQVAVVSADLRSRAETERMFSDIATLCGSIDAVVCNAAVFGKTPFATLSDEIWEEMLALNLTAPRRCIQHGIKLGARAIVNVLDIAATQAWSGYSAYGVAKAGLWHLTRILAKELRGQVRVNAVAPGLILMPQDASPQERARLTAKHAGQPRATPRDVAQGICFLLSEPRLTGVCLPIDAGESA